MGFRRVVTPPGAKGVLELWLKAKLVCLVPETSEEKRLVYASGSGDASSLCVDSDSLCDYGVVPRSKCR